MSRKEPLPAALGLELGAGTGHVGPSTPAERGDLGHHSAHVLQVVCSDLAASVTKSTILVHFPSVKDTQTFSIPILACTDTYETHPGPYPGYLTDILTCPDNNRTN